MKRSGKYIENMRYGITLANNCFSLVWQRKQLLLYCLIPAVLASLLSIFWFNITTMTQQPWTALFACPITTNPRTFHWLSVLLQSAGIICIIFISTLAIAALTHRVTHLLYGRSTSFLTDVLFATSKKWLLFIWTLIIAIETFIFHMINMKMQIMPFSAVLIGFVFIVIALCGCWKFISFFIIQTIIIGNVKTFTTALSQSARTAVPLSAQIAGGIIWIGIVASAYLGPLVILSFLVQTCKWAHWIISPLYVFIIIVLTTILTTFKTALYTSYTKMD